MMFKNISDFNLDFGITGYDFVKSDGSNARLVCEDATCALNHNSLNALSYCDIKTGKKYNKTDIKNEFASFNPVSYRGIPKGRISYLLLKIEKTKYSASWEFGLTTFKAYIFDKDLVLIKSFSIDKENIGGLLFYKKTIEFIRELERFLDDEREEICSSD